MYLFEKDEDSIVKQALLLSINDLHSNGNTSFYSNIMELSKSYNLPNFVPNNLHKTNFKISRYKDIKTEVYYSVAVFSNYTRKLEFYNTFKHCYEISSYLNLTRKTINRKALVKLRVSNHKLMIETGRFNQTPHDKRLCPVCDSNEIEDEIHFLCYCPKYFKLRNEFFAQIQSRLVLHDFQQLSNSDLVIKLMNSEDVSLIYE